ncbi:hypothetical protein D3C72_1271190 [compost metagenome]
MGNCNGLKAAGFGQLQRNVAQPADAEHRDLLPRLWCGIPQATPRRIARAHHGRGIHVGKAVGQQDRTLRRDGDVLGMATLCGKAGCARRDAVHCGLAGQGAVLAAIGAAATGRLHPGGAYAVTDATRVHAGTDLDDFPDNLVSGCLRVDVTPVALRRPHIGVAHARGMNLDQHLARLWSGHRNVVDFPRLVRSSHHNSFHRVHRLESCLGWTSGRAAAWGRCGGWKRRAGLLSRQSRQSLIP